MSGLHTGPYGMVANGTVTLTCDQASETEFVLANGYLPCSSKKQSDRILVSAGTFLRIVSVADLAGLDIESRTVNNEDRHEYIFVLRKKWEAETEAFLRMAASAGMGVKSGFGDASNSFCWFLLSEFGSRTIREEGYEY